jgi:hypothetical protein
VDATGSKRPFDCVSSRTGLSKLYWVMFIPSLACSILAIVVAAEGRP